MELAENNQLTTSSELTLEFTCSKLDNDTSFEIGITLMNLNGVRILLDSYGFRKDYEVKAMKSGQYKVQVKIPADLLSAGVYRVGLILCVNHEPVQELEAVLKFKIYPNDDFAQTRGKGSIIRPKLDWEVDRIEK